MVRGTIEVRNEHLPVIEPDDLEPHHERTDFYLRGFRAVVTEDEEEVDGTVVEYRGVPVVAAVDELETSHDVVGR